MRRMVQDLARNQHALARIKGVRDDRVTFLYQFRQAADRRIERMLFRYPIRCRVRSVKYPVRHMVPVFLDKRLFQMIRPNLLILAEIRFPDNIRHPRLDNLKSIFLQVALNLMIRARMEIEEILADDQDARARLARSYSIAFIRWIAFLKPRRAPESPCCSRPSTTKSIASSNA